MQQPNKRPPTGEFPGVPSPDPGAYPGLGSPPPAERGKAPFQPESDRAFEGDWREPWHENAERAGRRPGAPSTPVSDRSDDDAASGEGAPSTKEGDEEE